VISFLQELATLLGAGIPLLKALETLTRQHKAPFKSVLQQIGDQVAAGINLAEALEQHPQYFDELCVSIVQVGESSGALEGALERLAEFKDKTRQLRHRVTNALLYPAVVSLVGLAVTVFLMTYVVPNLLSVLEQSGKPLPTITYAVKACSDFLTQGWWILLLLLAGLLGGARLFYQSERGRQWSDAFLLKLPLIGDLIAKENTSRMAVIFAGLLRSGLPFVEAIRITRKTLKNRLFQQALADYEQAVIAGSDIAQPLRESGVFSPMVEQMLSVGQQSGQLETMLERLAQAYDVQVQTATHRMTTLMEPLLIVILAILVGFIAFATILPILEASNVL
jgi:type II secretory pathway component PulF